MRGLRSVVARMAVLVLLVFLVAACSRSSDQNMGAPPSGAAQGALSAEMSAPRPMAPTPAPAPAEPRGYGSSAPDLGRAEQSAGQRKIIFNADLNIEVESAEEGMQAVEALLATHGGYVQESRLTGRKDEERRVRMVVRVRTEQYGSFLAGLSDLGDVVAKLEYTQDVTEEFIDLDARLGSLREQDLRLRVLAERSGSLDELIRLENEIARVRSETEGIVGRLQFLNNRIDYSTVTLELVEPPPAVATLRRMGVMSRSVQAFADSVRDLIKMTENLIVLLAGILPGLIYMGALALAVVFVVRGTRRWKARREAATTTPSHQPPPPPVPPTSG